jgi:HK97 family phage major capsid protein
MDPVQSAALRRAADALKIAAGSSPSRKGPRFSLARMLDRMAEGQLDGLEAETLQEVNLRRGNTFFDRQRVHVPFSLLAARDLSVGSASGGGYLVSTGNLEPADILRPWSVAARAGASLLPNLVGNAALPLTTGNVTVYWLADELSPITGTQPTVGQIAIVPKTAGALCTFSRQLALQGFAAEYVRRELLRTVGTALDKAVLNGTGASGQPLGLLNIAGIGSESGTSFSHTSACAMKQAVAEANADDERITFVTTPAVRKLLETRERATGSGFVWDADRIASRPGFVTTDMPTATMIAGDWQHVIIATWGEGFEFAVNPFDPTGFKAGSIQTRVMLSCDVAVVYAGAFRKSASIT